MLKGVENFFMLKVIDMLPGSGKTTNMCEWLSSLIKPNSDQRFIFVTPYLKETEKVSNRLLFNSLTPFQKEAFKTGLWELEEFGNELPSMPQEELKKCRDAMVALSRNKNVVWSHVLFLKLAYTKAFWKLIEKMNYILVIDEEIPLKKDYVVQDFYISDMEFFLLGGENPIVSVNENGRLSWNCKDKKASEGMFCQLKKDIDTGNLYYCNKWLSWQVPIENFNLFDDVYLMTYRFEASLFSQVWNQEWEYYHFEGDELVPGKWKMPKELAEKIKRRLVIAERNFPAVGIKGHYSYSAAWYKEATDEDFEKMIKKMQYYLKKGASGKRMDRSKVLWTCFKDYKERIEMLDAGRDHFRPLNEESFVPLNMRASNDYLNRNIVFYLVNRYMGSPFSRAGEDWALSELLQLLFRTVLRLPDSEEPVYAWVPSDRMRELLIKWRDELGN